MKTYDIEQGSSEWRALRLGIPTASEFDKIVTPTGAFSKQSQSYMNRLAAERFLRKPLDEIGDMFWIRRGAELEPEAVTAYEFARNVSLRRVGFCTTDDGRLGASLDRMADKGAVEIKCPAPATHIGYLTDGFGRPYWHQVQGQMFVCDLPWVDLVSYYPGLPLHIERIERDLAYIRTLESALWKLCDELDALTERLRAMGAVEMVPEVET